jgi:hypothetical protein
MLFDHVQDMPGTEIGTHEYLSSILILFSVLYEIGLRTLVTLILMILNH